METEMRIGKSVVTKGLNANQLKVIAIIAMTIDHVTCVIFPHYPTDWWIILLYIIGRITAPTMWFFVAEGYHYTRDLKKYATRLLIFAVVSHFAYNFAFGIPFIPFQTSVFNQTSVIWALFCGLMVLILQNSNPQHVKPWLKHLLITILYVVAFCADWSSIAALAIVHISNNRGDFKKQMQGMVMYVAFYAAVYMLFINLVYGAIQMFVVLAIPFLKRYNGQRGNWKGMKWFFYLYYPLHLFLVGLLRIYLNGNTGVMIGG